ncbi:hypothetical protein WJ47_17020 [Burkholderia ubonensis]|uniref:Uncharacterized protein n=1 Tax=Burkholderia ubonensis TaxID=101571 RepID=A0AB73FZ88_9BURK|nr:hypothetical protein [Burkholderia ubonensis]KVK78128.1 hypothetical protein WJ44_15125 [Burkholderia ubonensis]KVL61814.1 hypothetical protein WJ47_17020 [Burkholderia ubonensis]KVM28592.1 hypothetical protein WJ53_09010 [Burkholderia ubonensis]KVM35103.1 hypothetical protein WJ54_36000 [Burkholderia ubonensis]
MWACTRASLAERSDGSSPAAPRWRATLKLHPAAGEITATWELQVIGKSNKARFVPVSVACVDALRTHGRDRR